ncbi:hypothetical protein, partial [Lewinella sp. JB7]|uniref:hypothetical protein n=1 Tax=Lewinella sp. JB7 TaxID=2962887 RepID=UPI0020C94858
EPHPYYAKGPNGPAGLRVKNETPQLIRLSAKLLSNILSTFTTALKNYPTKEPNYYTTKLPP